MKVTATELRRKLFSALDAASKGEPVEITYKGKEFRLMARNCDVADRLTAMQPVPGLVMGDLKDARKELLAEMESEWERDWSDQGL